MHSRHQRDWCRCLDRQDAIIDDAVNMRMRY
jgi:hypothetical protein